MNLSKENEVSQDDTEVISETFMAREYQVEILEAAKKQNTIACLGTGTGKTFIAVLLIREMAPQVVDGGKKIFFLVPTVPLVHQQADVIRNHTELEIGEYFGEMNIDTWSEKEWEVQFIQKQVLVMTAEICRIILEHCFLPVSSICLIIFDECHRASGKNPYCEIMERIKSSDGGDLPRIFGLSASVINKKVKPSKLETCLKGLEATLTSTIVTASDYSAVQKYGTDPDEVLVLYKNEQLNVETYKSSLIMLTDILTELKTNESIFSSIEENPEVQFFRKPYHSLSQLKEILMIYGPWFGSCGAKLYCKEIQKLLLHSSGQREILLKRVYQVLESCISDWNTGKSIHAYDIPHKLKKFLEIFIAIKNSHSLHLLSNNNNEHRSPVCVVFVEKRIIAYMLCQWIKNIASQINDFDFINAEFIVGHGTAGVDQPKESAMNVKKQEQIMKRFREKQFNVLIATSVVEEGMDIQKCNIVIRFDLPMNFRSYLQSKGRARAENSKYILLLCHEEQEAFIEDLCNYKTIEKFLMKESQNRDTMSDEEMQEYLKSDVILPYQPITAVGSPRITMTSSIGLLNRYCSLLPCDMATKLSPHWKLNPCNEGQLLQCTLWLPINSPLRQPITGQPMPKKKLAKMAAALKACEMLHKIGELNDHLLPFSTAIEDTCEELGVTNEEKSSDGTIPGTNRRRQLYKKKVADVLKIDIPYETNHWYLNVIVMDLVVPLAKSLNPRGRPIVNPADSVLGFALLTDKILPVIPRFPIFTKVGKIQISIECIGESFTLTGNQLREVKNFHKFVFSETLHLEKESFVFTSEASEFSSFVVPVKTDRCIFDENILDWEYIECTLQHAYHFQKENSNVWNGKQPDMEKFHNAVVARTYLMNKQQEPVFYYVTKVCENMNSNSSFDKKYPTFVDFFKDKYDVDITHTDLPLLDVERCTSFNYTKPLYVSAIQIVTNDYETQSKTKSKHSDFREYLVPELCLIHPFSSQFFRKATYLPSILYRMNQLLLAENIRISVAKTDRFFTFALNPSLQWPVFNFESSDKTLRRILIDRKEIIEENYDNLIQSFDILKNEAGEILSFERNCDGSPGPSPSLILQALTTKSAGDEFNLERLETIGDSFLKYAVSVALYSSFSNYDEGKLTQIRSRLIRNLNLYQKAKLKNLPEYLIHSPFHSQHSWLPPGYKMDERVTTKLDYSEKDKCTINVYKEGSNEVAQNLYTYQLISDKNIADAMEALIGAYLLSSGQKGALQFMHWLDLYPKCLLEESEGWPPVPSCPRINTLSDEASRNLLSGFDNFENRIGYKFKEPAYLLQAFTHPSYYPNELTDCFQRLEFLGDAILDFLITRKLFDDPKEHSPGKLTDLRSALVNNSYFASLAIKYGYHKNVKCMSITLCRQIDQFIQRQRDNEAFKLFEIFGYYLEEAECFDLEEVEVPKILGDLFESVAGAIYLDSGSSLDAVWKIYYPMIKPALEYQSHHVPIAPVRKLQETDTGIKFQYEDSIDGSSIASVTLSSGEVFPGRGPNKKVAKKSAAKRALIFLEKQKNSTYNESEHNH